MPRVHPALSCISCTVFSTPGMPPSPGERRQRLNPLTPALYRDLLVQLVGSSRCGRRCGRRSIRPEVLSIARPCALDQLLPPPPFRWLQLPPLEKAIGTQPKAGACCPEMRSPSLSYSPLLVTKVSTSMDPCCRACGHQRDGRKSQDRLGEELAADVQGVQHGDYKILTVTPSVVVRLSMTSGTWAGAVIIMLSRLSPMAGESPSRVHHHRDAESGELG